MFASKHFPTTQSVRHPGEAAAAPVSWAPVFLASILLSIFVASTPALAEDSEPLFTDEIFILVDGELQRRGIAEDFLVTVGPVDLDAVTLEFTEDGELLALMRDGGIYRLDQSTAAAELLAPPRAQAGESYLEMARAPGDRLFLIKQLADQNRDLVLFDLETGVELRLGMLRGDPQFVPGPSSPVTLSALAIAEEQLVGVDSGFSSGRLQSVGTATGGFYPLSERSLGSFIDQADIDSEGFIWVTSFSLSTPPSRTLYAVDGETLDFALGRGVYSFGTDEMAAFAIRRGSPPTCRGDESTICLLDRRFQVSVTWKDFDGNTGPGRIVPGASATTTLFSFFSPDNQELMVKVLDGCDFNDHVWVFLSGTTNVEFSLRVVDTLLGLEKSYDNLLGETASTVLDTEAFTSCADAGVPIGG